jgi:hypothetical protein
MKANEIVGYIVLAAFVIAVACIPLFWAVDRLLEVLRSRSSAAKSLRERREPGTEPRGPYRPVVIPGDDVIPGRSHLDRSEYRRFAEICASMPELAAYYRAPDDRWADVTNPDGES